MSFSQQVLKVRCEWTSMVGLLLACHAHFYPPSFHLSPLSSTTLPSYLVADPAGTTGASFHFHAKIEHGRAKLLIHNMQLYVNVFSFFFFFLRGGGDCFFSKILKFIQESVVLLWLFFSLPHINRMFNVQVKLITQFSLGWFFFCFFFLSSANTAVSCLW